MLDELRGVRLLDGPRGAQPVDREAVARLLVNLSAALEAHPEWLEVDLNPVLAGSTAALAVDALIVADPVHPAWDYEDPGGATNS
jgi:hypothetical protein